MVIGTDLSPIQSSWVPVNLTFLLDDFTDDWTCSSNTVDFVHICFLLGAIADWDSLTAEAYRVTRAGGWVESMEADARLLRVGLLASCTLAESGWQYGEY